MGIEVKSSYLFYLFFSFSACYLNPVLSLSGPGGAVRGGGKCPTAPPAGEGFLGDQSEESGNRLAECSGAERPTQQGGHHIITFIILSEFVLRIIV